MNHIRIGELCPTSSTPNRVLFFRDQVDPSQLARLNMPGLEIFGDGMRYVYPAAPSLLLASFALKRLRNDLTSIANDCSIEPPASILAPIEVGTDIQILHPINREGIPASLSVFPIKAYREANVGIAIANGGDVKGTFLVQLLKSTYLIRVFNSQRLDHGELAIDMEAALSRSFGLRDFDPFVKSLIHLILDNLHEGMWVHDALKKELGQLGLEMPAGLMTFTLNQDDANRLLLEI